MATTSALTMSGPHVVESVLTLTRSHDHCGWRAALVASKRGAGPAPVLTGPGLRVGARERDLR
jgi:hypothetical protein